LEIAKEFHYELDENVFILKDGPYSSGSACFMFAKYDSSNNMLQLQEFKETNETTETSKKVATTYIDLLAQKDTLLVELQRKLQQQFNNQMEKNKETQEALEKLAKSQEECARLRKLLTNTEYKNSFLEFD